MINLKTLVLGPLLNNCYILYTNKEAVVIDASWESEQIAEMIESLGLNLKYILITHGHVDHIVGAGKLKELTGAKILINEKDLFLYDHIKEQAQLFGFSVESLPPPDEFLTDNQEITIDGLTLKLIHTPGHTPGGLCYSVENKLFTGDTLFQGSIGRTDLWGGDYEQLIKSIKERLFTLGDDIEVYPGHGDETKIEQEKKSNPFLI